MRGRVKWFNDEKGYGFLSVEGGSDIFCHFSAIQMNGRKTLVEMQEVEFDVVPSEKGPKAANVKVVGE